MGSTSDKVKGNANELAGKIKKGVGGATDDPALENEGRAQESRGKAQQVKGDVKDSLKRGIDRA
ncbi:CsbD-like stress response protein [Azotobacter vinelandii CA]|uniref:CsbD-like stress response protein n=2 Tax=Azotobacter vinelandii TaxID=354 RepID=C1DH87_AZOVD|nr:CsbD family protein [Azotobacter vinelandii]ACO76494.1 CsbD-like stress response protein [Azotobacter vinelandii DJ]AGK15660.1 CsbD-like stress response protein [Azotobacter vinelandii CA]AGK19164.1 CsbD-like stress response protein [Azotobacter vinelandii CA6]WKN22269.1 CsbD family protein [Azotobacter vinelandii]SFX09280.1 Uncharacterized conserved protein YjbJ, UPF0337 family [Azotobacter vinelandii]